MPWNWELKAWPHFYYNEVPGLASMDQRFLLGAGGIFAVLNHFEKREKEQFVVELLSIEGLKSAKIEGEVLQLESLQSSIRRHFGFKSDVKKVGVGEKGMAELMCAVYDTYDQPLTHGMLHEWHRLLMGHRADLEDVGNYRSHDEPMQIVSNRSGNHTVYFQAPPSRIVAKEMSGFIEWFNSPIEGESILGKAAEAHVYFESIHPFEDGNGRIGRALVEKRLSHALGHPTLIAFSQIIDAKKKDYYNRLAECNRTLEIGNWVKYFSEVILKAQEHSILLINFLLHKAKLLRDLEGKINPRQEKVLLRIFSEGIEGFKGGLSAENYMAITKASRATATRDLADLLDLGALTKTGTLRHTRYWLKQ